MSWGCLAGAAALALIKQRLSASSCREPSSGPGSPLTSCADHGGCVYLDCNASSPIWPEVAAEMAPFMLSHFGNPSSDHAFGWPCNKALALARSRVARLLQCEEGSLVFTSCGTESDNHAIHAAVEAARDKPGPAHVVTSTIEHPAVQEHLRHLEARGEVTVTWCSVDGEGRVDSREVMAAVTPETALVTLMHSNNEVGSIQPVHEIATHCAAMGVLMHTDAAQSVGKVPVTLEALGPVDMVTLVGHKFGAPKGVAALYVRPGLRLASLLRGGGQEGGRRAGTENVMLLAGLGKAAELVAAELPGITQHMRRMRELLLQGLQRGLGASRLRVNGPADPALVLPNTLSVSIEGLQAAVLLKQLNTRVAASAAAACHSGGAPSPVLAAMGVPGAWAGGTLRLSVGRHTTAAEVKTAVEQIVKEAKAQLEVP